MCAQIKDKIGQYWTIDCNIANNQRETTTSGGEGGGHDFGGEGGGHDFL